MSTKSHRGTIVVEDAVVLGVTTYPGEQFVLRLQAPRCAARATPGSFAHIRCDDAIPMRRPLSIQRASATDGWIEILFKVVGEGLRCLAERRAGDTVSVVGPIGKGFTPSPSRPRPLLIGGGVGIPPMVFLAEWMQADSTDWQPLVLMGSELPFPCELRDSDRPVAGIPATVNRTMALIEEWGYPARLASLAGFDGCHRGYVTELADLWLGSLSDEDRAEVEIFSCGPTPMLQAVAAVARRHNVPCQVSLEEFMACAVGGCAGCTVLVQEADGPAMRRVCVDGPVFDARQVFPAAAAGAQGRD